MKTLEAKVGEFYRFRCDRCRSLFEMTAEERRENDWTCGEHEKGGKYDYPHNPLNKFKCPVCDTMRFMDKRTIHKFNIMKDVDGRTNELQEY